MEYKLDNLLVRMSNIVQVQDYMSYARPEFINRFGISGTNILEWFNRLPLSMRKILHTALIEICAKSIGKKHITYIWDTIYILIPSDCFADKERYMVFEDEKFRVPYKTEKYLTIMYGDYMKLPPEEKRYGHPFRLLDFDNSFQNSDIVKQYLKYKNTEATLQ